MSSSIKQNISSVRIHNIGYLRADVYWTKKEKTFLTEMVNIYYNIKSKLLKALFSNLENL